MAELESSLAPKISSVPVVAPSGSFPGSASNQRGKPPEERRGTLPPATVPPGCADVIRGCDSRKSGCASCGSTSTTGAAAVGLPRYLASDSPGNTNGSSSGVEGEGAEELLGWEGQRMKGSSLCAIKFWWMSFGRRFMKLVSYKEILKS